MGSTRNRDGLYSYLFDLLDRNVLLSEGPTGKVGRAESGSRFMMFSVDRFK